MWLLLIAGFVIAGAFGVDETVHPDKYPEVSAANGVELPYAPPSENYRPIIQQGE